MGKTNLLTTTSSSAATTGKFFTTEKQEHLIKLSILIIGAVLCEFAIADCNLNEINLVPLFLSFFLASFQSIY